MRAQRQVVQLEAAALVDDVKSIEKLLRFGCKPVAERSDEELADLIEYATGTPVQIISK